MENKHTRTNTKEDSLKRIKIIDTEKRMEAKYEWNLRMEC